MARWQNKLYEMSTKRCARITKVVRWVRMELCDLSRFVGTCPLEVFLEKMEINVLETYRSQAMDAVVKGTSVRWCDH
jgi:hypothetical protein